MNLKNLITGLMSALKAGSQTEPAVIEQANAIRASALRDLVFNDAFDQALEEEGKAIVEMAESVIRSAKELMAKPVHR